MTLTIRKAETSDAKLISVLGTTTFYEAYCEQDDSADLAEYVNEAFNLTQIESELNDADSTFFIAELGGNAVAYAKLRENSRAECLKDENAIELQRIYVLRHIKGKGVGFALIRKCFEAAREKDYETIWLGVWEENLAAQGFYKKLGFKRVGELYFPYGSEVGTNFVLKRELETA